MDGNLVEQRDSTLFWLKSLEEKSFEKEKKIYEMVKEKIKINSPKDLTAENCRKLFGFLSEDSLLGNNNSKYNYVYYMLRDPRFYLNMGVNSNNVKKSSYVVSRSKAKENKTGITLTQEILRYKTEETILKHLNTRIWQQLKEKWGKNIEKQIAEYNEDKKNQNIQKEKLYDIKLEMKDLNNYNIRINKDGLLWNKNDIILFITDLEEKIQKTYPDFYIFPKNDYFIIQTNLTNLSEEDIYNEFKQKMENTTSKMVNIYENEKKNEDLTKNLLNEMEKFLENKKLKIISALKKPEGKALLFGKKTLEKLIGDIMEFLLNILIYDEENLFIGDIQTRSGLAAVDNIIKRNGFQCKNLPSKISSNKISLYDDVLTVTLNDNVSDRIFTEEEKKKLFIKSAIYQKNQSSSYRNDILMLLQKSFPNAIRYEQRDEDFGNTDNEEIINILRGMTNTFYLLNFYLIPSSRIFYELREQLNTEFGKPKNTLIENFYEAVETDKKPQNINYFDSLTNMKATKKKSLFKIKKFILYFKGITFDFNNIKGKISGNNILAK